MHFSHTDKTRVSKECGVVGVLSGTVGVGMEVQRNLLLLFLVPTAAADL